VPQEQKEIFARSTFLQGIPSAAKFNSTSSFRLRVIKKKRGIILFARTFVLRVKHGYSEAHMNSISTTMATKAALLSLRRTLAFFTRRHASRGMIMPLMAISLSALLGFAGLAVDVTYLEYWQQEQQTATDAAALGGAQTLAHSNCASASNAETAAVTDAGIDGFANTGNNTVSAVSPPTTGPWSGKSCAITVKITAQHVSTFFSRLFGYAAGMSESTTATATTEANAGGACIYLLSPNTWSSFNNATVNAPGCAIAINYSADFNGGTINAPFIGYAGTSPNYGGTTFTAASPMPMLSVSDPCSEIPGCSYLTSNPPALNNCQSLNTNGGSQTIQPGCYTNLILDCCGTITMASGTYIINGNFNDNGVTLQGSGVTIYTTANGNAPNFDNSYPTILTPPTPPNNYANVLYYQVPSNTSGIHFNGSQVQMQGLIYAPGTTGANFNDSGGGYTVLVFGSMNFNNNSASDFASPPPGQALIQQAVLAQ
jgi:hypothetical protein